MFVSECNGKLFFSSNSLMMMATNDCVLAVMALNLLLLFQHDRLNDKLILLYNILVSVSFEWWIFFFTKRYRKNLVILLFLLVMVSSSSSLADNDKMFYNVWNKTTWRKKEKTSQIFPKIFFLLVRKFFVRFYCYCHSFGLFFAFVFFCSHTFVIVIVLFAMWPKKTKQMLCDVNFHAKWKCFLSFSLSLF